MTNLFFVSLEESQEAGLGAGRALDPAESEVVAGVLQVSEVHQQVLSPQTGPLTHRGQLGRPTSYSISNNKLSRHSYTLSVRCYSCIQFLKDRRVKKNFQN